MCGEISIAETEWKVMEVLWNDSMLTIGEIRKALADTGWSDSTIKTLVRRLHKKGAVGIDDTQGQYRYFAVVKERECKIKEVRRLVDRIYNGSFRMMMASLASQSSLPEDEKAQLMEIIEKMEEDD